MIICNFIVVEAKNAYINLCANQLIGNQHIFSMLKFIYLV